MFLNELDDTILKKIFSFLLMPKQINTLKEVCRRWRNLINTIPFLSLNNGLQQSPNKVVIAMAPVNSSGDIYHMLAFIILSLHHEKQIPPILLTYDQKVPETFRVTQNELNTGVQVVQRAMNFISHLGYQDCFITQKIPLNGPQPIARQNALENKLAELSITHYIDHRLSTSIIADFFQKEGFDKTTAILREGFLCQHGNKKVKKYVKNTISEITKLSKNNKPVAIIHNRISGKSNRDNSLSTIIQRILKQLKSDGYNVIVIYADSRFSGYSNIPDADIHIRPFQQDNDLINKDEDFGKLAHLELFLRLYDVRENIQLKGIIGNTSGTLDLAAFIGHRVFNIHHFEPQKLFDYQDYRVFLQMSFFAVARDDIDGADNKLIQDISAWLKKTEINQPRQYLHLTQPTKFTGLGKIGFSFFYSVKEVQQKKWCQQNFFFGTEKKMNEVAKEANLLERNFYSWTL